jgi:hypothetical protein
VGIAVLVNAQKHEGRLGGQRQECGGRGRVQLIVQAARDHEYAGGQLAHRLRNASAFDHSH